MAGLRKPIVAVTMGDPAGVGPEVIVRAWGDAQVHEHVRAIVVGHPEIMRRAAELVGRDLTFELLRSPDEFTSVFAAEDVMPVIKACGDDAAATPVSVV